METTKLNSPSLYINEHSPYQRRDNQEEDDSDFERTEEDDYNDKAKVIDYRLQSVSVD